MEGKRSKAVHMLRVTVHGAGRKFHLTKGGSGRSIIKTYSAVLDHGYTQDSEGHMN